MPVYCGIGGVKHKISGLYTGVGGVKKEATELWSGNGGVKKLVYQAIKGTPVGDLPVGSIILLNENNVPAEYIVVHQGKPSDIYDDSCNGTWVLRKDIVYRIDNFGTTNAIENLKMTKWLNDTMFYKYDSDVRQYIKTVRVPYRKKGGISGEDAYGSQGFSCKVFLLSGYEIGATQSDDKYHPIDGAKLSYFESGESDNANSKRKANYNNSPSGWWTRSPYTEDDRLIIVVQADGSVFTADITNTVGVRPTIILPPDFPAILNQN